MKNPFAGKAPDVEEVLTPSAGGLGTFGGVFTPSILTILGVIMYLRFGWVVGNLGLIGTLMVVTLATSITFLTALSIAAIATDQRVRIGGAYYMISPVSYTHLRAHETDSYLVCRLLLEK